MLTTIAELPLQFDLPVASKLDVPAPPPAHIPRGDLVARVADALAGRLTLVVAPAGYGKTTTVADAARQAGRSVAWVTLDAADREPAMTWHDVRVAVETVVGGGAIMETVATARRSARVTAQRLVESSPELLLVVDDPVGALTGETAELLDAFVDWVPGTVSVAVLARQLPDLSVHRRRARGSVTEFWAEDLRFDRDDVATYLNGAWRLELGDAELQRLAAETEGWPAILHLVARRLSGAAPREGTIEVTLDSRVADYVIDEALASLSSSDRRFLEEIVSLDRVTPELGAAVAGLSDASDVFAGLVARGLLLPLSEAPGTSRPHRLVRAVMGREPSAAGSRRATLIRAAAWLADHGHRHDAARAAVDGGDAARAADWLEAGLEQCVRADGGALLRQVVTMLRPDALVEHPRVTETGLDALLLAGDQVGLEEVLACLQAAPDPAVDRLTSTASGYLARLRGDAVAVPPAGDADAVASHVPAVTLGTQGWHGDAARLMQHAVRSAVIDGGSPLRELVVVADFAWERATAGRLGEADLLVRRASRLAAREGSPIPAQVLLAKAQIALDRGQSSAALEAVNAAQAGVDPSGDLAVWAECQLLVGRVRAARGDLNGTVAILDELHARLATVAPGSGLEARVARAEAGLRLAMGDVASLPRVFPDLLGSRPLEDVAPEDRLLLARVHLKRGDVARAMAVARSLGRAGSGPRIVLGAARVEAASARALGDTLLANRAQKRALEIARAEGMLGVSLAQVPRASIADEGTERPVVATAPAPRTTPSGIPPLTARELDVLRQLPSRLSNHEIASGMYVSVNTVKSHLKSIYRKLDVTTRRDAISRAREFAFL